MDEPVALFDPGTGLMMPVPSPVMRSPVAGNRANAVAKDWQQSSEPLKVQRLARQWWLVRW